MLIDQSKRIIARAIEEFSPTHIVSMVSGGKDSAASHQAALELGLPVDFVMHGNTRCGIPETTEFVRKHYGASYVEADAGTAYEDYVLRKGFFGKGIAAHGFAYRILKAGPFRREISKHIRQGKRDVRVMLLNGARKDESENRQKHLKPMRHDPAAKNNLWVNIIHGWSEADRDQYLQRRETPINPVAKALCRSGECMCGTMQSKSERVEAAHIYPEWGRWLDGLEKEVRAIHGYGWGESQADAPDPNQFDMFQPMCKDCVNG